MPLTAAPPHLSGQGGFEAQQGPCQAIFTNPECGITMTHDIWGYGSESSYTAGTNLTGYKVEATDGTVGKVDEATYDGGSSYIVVNCKPWLIGKHVMLPAGTITRIDAQEETIHVNRTKDQIKDAPVYTEDLRGDAAYRGTLGTYYEANKH